MNYYDVAQICLNGHIINERFNTAPENNASFCSKCGQPTITKCNSCGANIKGYYHMDGIVDWETMQSPPSYCLNCGKPYPWMTSSIEAIKELIEIDEQLQEEEKQSFKEILPDLITETPKTQVAVKKFNIFLKKATKFTGEAIKAIIVAVISAEIRKQLGLLP